MPNIRQQKKRVRTAGKQRLENLHYRSTAKTLAKRLETAVKDGDQDRVAAEDRELVRWLGRPAAHRGVHRRDPRQRGVLPRGIRRDKSRPRRSGSDPTSVSRYRQLLSLEFAR